jgi:hypothetical protein
MKRSVQFVLTMLLTALMSSSAFATVSFSDDFESYPIYEGGDPTDLGGGWTLFVNVFSNFPACDGYLYGYGPFAAPNGPNVSNIVAGDTGNALNAFSNYDDDQHANGNCLETNVFQERIVTGLDVGSYTFRFETQVPGDLGAGVQTYGFIKLIDVNNFSTLFFETASTETAGVKSITIDLDSAAEGHILQWGFANVASNYLPSGRWYDNVEFDLSSVIVPGTAPALPVPVPFWAYLVLGGLLAWVGGTALRSRRKA